MGHDAKKLISDFINDHLSGDLNNIRNFDFETLYSSQKFGCPGRKFDCDDTNIMRAIYVILWQDLLPGLSMNNCGSGSRQYRGETLNTFHTMFGKANPNYPGHFYGLEKYAPSDEIREKVRRFRKICHLLGNYAVLPNWRADNTTINCYRGTNDWHDFFDQFLIELYNILTASPQQNDILKKLVSVNHFCFDKFMGIDGFCCFARGLLLTDYCTAGMIPVKIFAGNYHWKDENDSTTYMHDAMQYIEQAEAIIRQRTDNMCKILFTKLYD
ncbi:MAG: hypothetical protein E7058_03965 [Lentisphaerae bacterium]|nr:hypothetical protein [Lentisphaerota bacterium]